MLYPIAGVINFLFGNVNQARYQSMGTGNEVNAPYPTFLAKVFKSCATYRENELQSVERISAQNKLLGLLVESEAIGDGKISNGKEVLEALADVKRLGVIDQNQYSAEGINFPRGCQGFIEHIGVRLNELNFIEGMQDFLSDKGGKLKAVSLSVYHDYGPKYSLRDIDVNEGKDSELDLSVTRVINNCLVTGTPEMLDTIHDITVFDLNGIYTHSLILALENTGSPEMAQHVIDKAVEKSKVADFDLKGFVDSARAAALKNKVYHPGVVGGVGTLSPRPAVIELLDKNFGEGGKHAGLDNAEAKRAVYGVEVGRAGGQTARMA